MEHDRGDPARMSPATERDDPYQGIIAAVLGGGTADAAFDEASLEDSPAGSAAPQDGQLPSAGNTAIDQDNARIVLAERSGPRTRGAAKRERSNRVEDEPTSKAPRRSTRARTPFKFQPPPEDSVRRKRKSTVRKENIQPTKRSRKADEPVLKKSSRERMDRRRRRSGHSEALFSLGSIARGKKTQLAATLKDLNAKVMSGSHGPKTPTHVIVESLTRTEETLSGMASGAWIVGSDYLASCQLSEDLLAEAPFEMHKTENVSISDGAPKHWRTRCKNLGTKAFAGVNAVFYGTMDSPGAATLERIISSGGGHVLKTAGPFTSVLDKGSVNLAVIGRRKAKGDRTTKAFVAAGIQCVTEQFIVDWLAHPEANLDHHCLFGTRSPDLQQLEADRSFA